MRIIDLDRREGDHVRLARLLSLTWDDVALEAMCFSGAGFADAELGYAYDETVAVRMESPELPALEIMAALPVECRAAVGDHLAWLAESAALQGGTFVVEALPQVA